MQNQAAVEALYSATFVEDYLDCVENLPNDLQRHLSRLREFDLTQYSVSIHFVITQVKSLGPRHLSIKNLAYRYFEIISQYQTFRSF